MKIIIFSFHTSKHTIYLIKQILLLTMLQTIRLFLAVALFFTAVSVQAQAPIKCGHMNLGNLLIELPETTNANKALEAFAAGYAAKGDSLGKIFEAAATTFQKEYQEGKLIPVVAQQQYAALEKQQKELENYQKISEQAVSIKRDELLNPILTKIYDSIKAVAKENGYLMIFDTSTGAALYALESEDVTSLVKKKMGL